MAGEIQKNHALAALILGIIEIVVAVVIVICSIVMAVEADIDKGWTPYWAGIPFAIAGILGVVTGCMRGKCLMISFMVTNILCFVLQGVSTILMVIVLALFSGWKDYCRSGTVGFGPDAKEYCVCTYNGNSYSYEDSTCDFMSDISTIAYVVIAALILGALAALAGSILACIAVCCMRNEPQTVVVQQPGMVMQPPNSTGSYPTQGYPQQQQSDYPTKDGGYPQQQNVGGYPQQQQNGAYQPYGQQPPHYYEQTKQ